MLLLISLTASLLLAPPPTKATHRSSHSKVLVKNIPFEADEHALRDKLAAFGPVNSVQLGKASKRHHACHHGRPPIADHTWAGHGFYTSGGLLRRRTLRGARLRQLEVEVPTFSNIGGYTNFAYAHVAYSETEHLA